MMPLRGLQLSFFAEVPSYDLANPILGLDRPHSHQPYRPQVGRYYVEPAIDVAAVEVVDESPPEQQKRSRRHTPKGQASGWIETRIGNRKRQKPSVSHYYKWDDPEGRGSRYLPAGKLAAVTAMVYQQRCSIEEVLQFLDGGDRHE